MLEISPEFVITDIELVAGECNSAEVSIYSADLDAPFFIEYRLNRDKFFALLKDAMTALWDEAPIIITFELVEGNAEVISVKRV
jgi:hypothetical protein